MRATTETPTASPPRWWAAVVVLLAVLVYAPSLGSGFALDDPLAAKQTLPVDECQDDGSVNALVAPEALAVVEASVQPEPAQL